LSLFLLRPHPHFSSLFDLDVNHIWSATNRAILDVFLALARRQIEWDDNLFATGIRSSVRWTDAAENGQNVPLLLVDEEIFSALETEVCGSTSSRQFFQQIHNSIQLLAHRYNLAAIFASFYF
jgi:hypothetical protein